MNASDDHGTGQGHGTSKFESPAGSSLKHYKSMFASVSDIISWTDMVAPASSYPSSFSDWKDMAEGALDDTVKDGELSLSRQEEDGVAAAREIGFGIMEKFFATAKAVGWSSQTADVRRAEIIRILSLPQVPQRTQEWYLQGKSVLTASEFGNLFGSPRAIRQLAFQKVLPQTMSSSSNRLACLTHEMGPFDWGIRFEPVVKQILAERWGVTIMDSGRLMHPTDPLLAASPDGLITEATDSARIGRLIEIKCPISREIGDTIPFEYWCQMQIQMEVTGIEECEYVEVKIDSISPKKADLSGSTPDGYLWLFQSSTTCQMSYAYTEAEKDEFTKNGLDLIETIPWRLAKFYSKTVTRDRAWFEGTAKLREDFWSIVGQARRGEIQPFEVKSRSKVIVTKEPECRIVDDI
jgi:hypothetical protein